MIVVITGAARSGKSTFASYLREAMQGREASLIDPAKEILSIISPGWEKDDEVRGKLVGVQAAIAKHFPSATTRRLLRLRYEGNSPLIVQMRRPMEIEALKVAKPGFPVQVVKVRSPFQLPSTNVADKEAEGNEGFLVENTQGLEELRETAQSVGRELARMEDKWLAALPPVDCEMFRRSGGVCGVTGMECTGGVCPMFPHTFAARGEGGLEVGCGTFKVVGEGPESVRWKMEESVPKVVHVEDRCHDVYIGKGSEYGNEFFPGMEREEAIAAWRDAFHLTARQHKELTGAMLGCHCVPKACHGMELVRKWLLGIAGGIE